MCLVSDKCQTAALKNTPLSLHIEISLLEVVRSTLNLWNQFYDAICGSGERFVGSEKITMMMSLGHLNFSGKFHISNRKPVLQDGDVEFERYGYLLGREGLTKNMLLVASWEM